MVRKVQIRGLTDIMFDRYPGDNDTKLEPWQKLYLAGESGRTICLPSANIMSFLSAQNTDSAPKRLLDSRKYKAFALACGSFVTIGPRMIPFLRDGQPIEFGKFVGDDLGSDLASASQRSGPVGSTKTSHTNSGAHRIRATVIRFAMFHSEAGASPARMTRRVSATITPYR